MELLEGETLHHRLARGPLELASLVDISLALANALDAAHATPGFGTTCRAQVRDGYRLKWIPSLSLLMSLDPLPLSQSLFFFAPGFGLRELTYSKLRSKNFFSSCVEESKESGTSTYSG